jgi:hypothetical protein
MQKSALKAWVSQALGSCCSGFGSGVFSKQRLILVLFCWKADPKLPPRHDGGNTNRFPFDDG